MGASVEYFLEKQRKKDKSIFCCHFLVTIDENLLTEQIAKHDILPIFAHFGPHCPFPTRVFILGAVLRGGIDPLWSETGSS